MKLYLKRRKDKILYDESDTEDELIKTIQEFVDDHYEYGNIGHYMRRWLDNEGHLLIDFGSHTDFFFVEGE